MSVQNWFSSPNVRQHVKYETKWRNLLMLLWLQRNPRRNNLTHEFIYMQIMSLHKYLIKSSLAYSARWQPVGMDAIQEKQNSSSLLRQVRQSCSVILFFTVLGSRRGGKNRGLKRKNLSRLIELVKHIFFSGGWKEEEGRLQEWKDEMDFSTKSHYRYKVFRKESEPAEDTRDSTGLWRWNNSSWLWRS